MEGSAVRAHFLEEAADNMMYFTDMLRYHISKANVEKYGHNMRRSYDKKYGEKYKV